MYRKSGKLGKYLNHNSHHHRLHKMAVLSGMELHLALLTTRTPTNEDLSLPKIYPEKHNALQLAEQIKFGQKMRMLKVVLEDESSSGPARLEKKSRAADKRDSLLVVKYANLGSNHRPIIQIIKHLRNECKLKWLRPRVIYSRHANLQEKLLGDLQQKVMCGVVDADFDQCPCNCPRNYKVNGECAYSGEQYSCRTAVIVYKISCNASNCNCFYIGKLQSYVKTLVQEHIGEVTKLYN
jgi:hypothetical protein